MKNVETTPERARDSLLTQQYTVIHHEQLCRRPYEEVVAAFEAAVGDGDDGKFLNGLNAVSNVTDWEALCKRFFGPSGFVHILSFDHGHWLKFYGVDAKVKQYTYGNPLLAYTMVKHDVAATFQVPFRVLIYEHANGDVRIAFDLPSSLVAHLNNEEIDGNARQIDKKVLAFMAQLAGE